MWMILSRIFLKSHFLGNFPARMLEKNPATNRLEAPAAQRNRKNRSARKAAVNKVDAMSLSLTTP